MSGSERGRILDLGRFVHDQRTAHCLRQLNHLEDLIDRSRHRFDAHDRNPVRRVSAVFFYIFLEVEFAAARAKPDHMFDLAGIQAP